MCRPSCCKPRSQAPGIAAVALIIGAGIAVHKISHVLAQIAHDTINVLLEYPAPFTATFEATLVPGVTGEGIEFCGTEGRLWITRQRL